MYINFIRDDFFVNKKVKIIPIISYCLLAIHCLMSLIIGNKLNHMKILRVQLLAESKLISELNIIV